MREKNQSLLGIWSIFAAAAFVLPLPSVNALQEDTKTLRQKVIEEGGDISVGANGDSIHPDFIDLAALISKATLIVEGRVVRVQSHLTPDERGITTEFQMHLITIISNAGAEIKGDFGMVLDGGRIEFPEGNALVDDGSYPVSAHPIVGQELILFLQSSPVNPTKYEPVANARAVFRVTKEDKIEPAADAGLEFRSHERLLGMEHQSFINEVRALIGTQRRQ